MREHTALPAMVGIVRDLCARRFSYADLPVLRVDVPLSVPAYSRSQAQIPELTAVGSGKPS